MSYKILHITSGKFLTYLPEWSLDEEGGSISSLFISKITHVYPTTKAMKLSFSSMKKANEFLAYMRKEGYYATVCQNMTHYKRPSFTELHTTGYSQECIVINKFNSNEFEVVRNKK